MLSIPTSSGPLRAITQWLVPTTCHWGYIGLVQASITPIWVCFMVDVWYFWYHTAVHRASAGSGWRGRNRLLLCFWGCDEDRAAPFLKRAPLMGARFVKYPTRVSTKEQKCSFGFRMYVRHREAIVWKAVCMIWSIRNGAERLPCLPGICITISGIQCYLL